MWKIVSDEPPPVPKKEWLELDYKEYKEMKMGVKGALNRAADLLEKGWCQKLMKTVRVDPTGAELQTLYCALGAINDAARSGDEYFGALDALAANLTNGETPTDLNEIVNLIAKWNDHKDQDEDTVATTFRAIADLCKE